MKDRDKTSTVLPELAPIPGLEVQEPIDLLSEIERADLKGKLDKMALERRKAEAKSRSLRLG